MKNIAEYDPSYSPSEIFEMDDRPNCTNCGDSGVIHEGRDVRSTTFCECDLGEETFIAWADGEAQMREEGSFLDW